MAVHPDAIKREQEARKLSDEIAELNAQIQAATYRFLVLVREFDKRGYWNDGWIRSCAHWLSWLCSIDLGAAREKVRVARALEHLPLTSDALRKAKISYSKARAITRVATPKTEEGLLDIALHGSTSQVERVVRAWRKADREAELEQANDRHAARGLSIYTDAEGMVVLNARLTPEVGAVVRRALEAAKDKLYEDDKDFTRNSLTHRQADAIGVVAEAALNNELDPGTRGDRYQVVVHVDQQVLESPENEGQSLLEDGAGVSAETSRRISCDSSKVDMVHGEDGQVLDVGRKTRTIPAPIRRALLNRDKTCRFPGCDLKGRFAHHIKHWAEGGETKLGNLCLLCWMHHRSVHEGGYGVEVLDNGELQFYWRNGEVMVVVPPPPLQESDPVEALRKRHREDGLDIDSSTTTQWEGDPMDLGLVMDSIYKPPPPPNQGFDSVDL